MNIILLLFASTVAKGKVEPFGTILGSNNGVIGYSNGKSGSAWPNYEGFIFTGISWQCVEYSRRWLLKQKHLVFGSVNCASDIWHLNDLSYVYYYPFYSTIPFYRVPNSSKCQPKQGNILIYSRGSGDMTHGHVAVITKVTKNEVFIAEENWDNEYWPEGDYSRILALKTIDGVYTIVDEDYAILGWMVYEDYDLECADIDCKTCTSPSNNPENPCTYD